MTDAQWQCIKSLLPRNICDPGCRVADNRLLVHAVFYVLKTGIPWANPPERIGKNNTVWKRYERWYAASVWNSSPGGVELPVCTDAKLGGPEILGIVAVPVNVS
ncbi:MAG: transposase [Phycisphaerae bacterium]